jgi:serine/threonine protein kinase
MHSTTVADLFQDLREHGLLSADRLGELEHHGRVRLTDPPAVAKYLVQRGWLTVYQMNQLLQGQADGLVLGPYRLEDRLAHGGISQVFKAWDTRRKCTVALKVLNLYQVSETAAERQFQREIEAVTSLRHPNIVTALDTGQVRGRHFLAMAYIEGLDLAKLVQLSGPLPVAQACDYIRQAALGLQHAYEHWLVHRDIKPANLLATHALEQNDRPVASAEGQPSRLAGPRVQIIDWGLAHVQRPGAAEQATEASLSAWVREGMLIGTADYLAPEQARSPRTVDVRADIYSLGCTLYYLLTGQPPFPGVSLPLKLQQHAEMEPRPLHGLDAHADSMLTPILRKMMAKRPEDRYRTPAAVAVALAPLCRILPPRPNILRKDL